MKLFIEEENCVHLIKLDCTQNWLCSAKDITPTTQILHQCLYSLYDILYFSCAKPFPNKIRRIFFGACKFKPPPPQAPSRCSWVTTPAAAPLPPPTTAGGAPTTSASPGYSRGSSPSRAARTSSSGPASRRSKARGWLTGFYLNFWGFSYQNYL